MVWACFSHSGPGPLVPVEGTLRQDQYVGILQQHLVPFTEERCGAGQCYFQQDNAPCHKSRRVMAFLQEQVFAIMEWPPFSPDLNPIENLWAIVKEKVHSGATSDKNELYALVWCIWMEDSGIKDACKALVEGMPRRVQACIRSKGGPIKY